MRPITLENQLTLFNRGTGSFRYRHVYLPNLPSVTDCHIMISERHAPTQGSLFKDRERRVLRSIISMMPLSFSHRKRKAYETQKPQKLQITFKTCKILVSDCTSLQDRQAIATETVPLTFYCIVCDHYESRSEKFSAGLIPRTSCQRRRLEGLTKMPSSAPEILTLRLAVQDSDTRRNSEC